MTLISIDTHVLLHGVSFTLYMHLNKSSMHVSSTP